MQKISTKKVMVTGTVLAILLLLVPVFVSAQSFEGLAPPEIPGEVVYIPFDVDITLDGDLSDWEGVPVIEVIDDDAADPAENGSFTFAVAADQEFLYITMQMPDQNIVAGQHGTDFWNEDSFEFYLNTSGDLNASSYASGIFQININATDIGNTDPEALTITGTFSSGQPVYGYVFETEDGWGIEVAVPLEGLVVPAHGVEIGFQAQINGATQLDRDVKIIWSNADTNDQSWEKPYLFGRAIFFEIGQTDIPQPSERATEPTPTPTPTPFVIPPQVSVNQTGYFVEGEKLASLASDATTPINWQLLNSSDEVVLEGQTIVKGDDAASGDHLHWIDFTAFTTPGSDYRIVTDELESVPFDISDDVYQQLKHDALAYFYHNRSGITIQAEYAGTEWARPAGHITDDDVTCYKGDDPAGNSWDGCDYTLDASGGWYDAGDYGKYVVNGGFTAWTLMNLFARFPEAFPDGSLKIPENSNGVPDILDEARWELKFLLGMQVPAGQPLAGMVHHKLHGLTWDPIPKMPPMRVDNDNQHQSVGSGRYVYAPSTAATLNLAATAAQCARIWKEIDADFSLQCLDAAESAWAAALAHPTVYFGNTPGDGGGNYDDDTVSDEFYWAAAELYITTGADEYKNYLLESDRFAAVNQFDWREVAPLGTIALLVNNNQLDKKDKDQLEENLIQFADEFITLQENEGYTVLIQGDYPWGSNGLILNNMMLMKLAHELTGEAKYLDAVRLSMDYIMGRNPNNISYVAGYGTYSMEHPHHRFWANELESGFPPPPPGAIAGGANTTPTDPVALEVGLMDEAPSKRYIDDIESYSTNEVAINWNASLTWVAASLDEKGVGLQTAEVASESVLPTAEAAQESALPAWVIPVGVAVVLIIVVVGVIWFIRNRKK